MLYKRYMSYFPNCDEYGIDNDNLNIIIKIKYINLKNC